MWKTILDLLFPIQCLGCGKEGNFICYSCFKKLPLNTKKSKNNLLIASYYKNLLIKQLIHKYKYDFIKDLAKPLGLLMVKKLQSQEVRPQKVGTFSKKVPLFRSDLCLVPIPLHQKRLKWRGFNQAELLAQEISKKTNIPVINNLLIRIKHTLPQMKIQDAKQRKKNMNQAFALNPNFNNNLENKNIILIDDISTTGATMKECAKALKPLKPKNILGLVIAKG